ncbi:MAG: lamin tail domain-containing protein [bacterium]
MIRLVFSTLIFLFLIASNAQAGIIINEVMANEPGGDKNLEWLELYNDSQETVSLENYQIQIGSKVIEFASDIELEAGAYQVFCKDIFIEGTPQGFGEYWGDGSRIWGDSYQESLILTPIEISESFSLTNSSGTILLYDNNDNLVSEFEWTSSGLDGYSWERFSPLSDVIEQSVDLIGSTPGYVNSITPVPNDLAIELLDVYRSDGFTNISLLISNVGTSLVSDAELQIDEVVSEELISPLETISIPALMPQETYTVNASYDNLFIYYTTINAALSLDDRLNNNELTFVAPGSEFPPVVLNEFLANPTSDLNAEWVEIYNRSPYPFNISDWEIGDSLHVYTITSSEFYIEAGEFLILAEDSINFKNYYSNFNGHILEPKQWASLNNGSDKVRLVDQYGLELDHYLYNKVYPNNQTLARENDVIHRDVWGYSEIPDGTPGEFNSDIYFSPTGSDIKLTIRPEVFSPDGDFVDEFATITVEAPGDKDYKLKIYDKQGREVYSFDQVQDINTWHGENNGGDRLPIGIYIVYLEVVGMESIKKPIVIAR